MADGFVPPATVRSNAKRGLELREKHGRGGTAIGVARARDLSNGKSISYDTIKRMHSYFSRHEVDKKGEGWGKDSAGYIAWLLWGGDAGWSWARGIIRQQESKEKSTMNDMTTSYFSIEKADRNADGTLLVYGKATDDSVDIDQQICDATWLERAMPAWFKSGGNIREQHSQIAAGVAKEYEPKADGHYISALVVDPVSVKKVETGVLKGFSIGIKRPRVVRDMKAANGRIIDGEIVEVSLVDRPANPNAKLMLAKSVDGEPTLVQVEELVEDIVKHPGHPDQKVHAGGRGRGGAGAGAPDSADTPRDPSVDRDNASYSETAKKTRSDLESTTKELYEENIKIQSDKTMDTAGKMDAQQAVEDGTFAIEDAHEALNRASAAKTRSVYERHMREAGSSMVNAGERINRATRVQPLKRVASKLITNGKKLQKEHGATKSSTAELRKALQSALDLYAHNKSEEIGMGKTIVELPVAAVSDLLKFDKTQFEAARNALAELISIEAQESKQGHNEINSLTHLLEAVSHLHAWYEGEEAEGEVEEMEEIELAAKAEVEGSEGCDCAGCKACKSDGGCSAKMCKGHKEASVEKETEEKSAEITKCLECGCNQPGTDHGLTTTNDFANVSKPSHVTTAEMYSPDQTPKSAEPEETTTEDSAEEPKSADVEAIVEQAIKSATQSIRTEIEALMTAKEAAESHAMSLETELAQAKSLAVAGGPKRTAKPVAETSSDLLVKAAMYNAKAKATTDPTLAKGYKALADQYAREHDTLNK